MTATREALVVAAARAFAEAMARGDWEAAERLAAVAFCTAEGEGG